MCLMCHFRDLHESLIKKVTIRYVSGLNELLEYVCTNYLMHFKMLKVPHEYLIPLIHLV